MSRPLRHDPAGAIWHVTSRGNERKDIFRDDVDRRRWLDLLGRTAEASNWRIHAYTQMGNHFHLVIETTMEGTLSPGMRQLNGVYAQWFNRRHDRVGHLFQGRFHAVFVDREEYLLELLRYVAQNPVRAGMVTSAADWAWSSHRAMAGSCAAPSWLETSWALNHLGGSRLRYADFVAETSPTFNPRQLHGKGIALGKEGFRRKFGEMAAELDVGREVPLPQRSPEPWRVEDLLPRLLFHLDVTRDELCRPRRRCEQRARVAFGLRQYSRAPGRVIAPFLGVSPWQAARLARRGRETWSTVDVVGLPA